MKTDLDRARKILIIGDSGRGKSTFSKKLSEKLGLSLYSTDDFFWKVKFTEPNDRAKSIEDIKIVYEKDSWIVEGGTLHLFAPGLDRADVVLNLVFRNIFAQWRSLIRRNRGRDNENIWAHLAYVTRKRFGIGNDKEKRKRELLERYKDKTVIIRSFREMDALLQS